MPDFGCDLGGSTTSTSCDAIDRSAGNRADARMLRDFA